ncbi:hypothetical protein PV433_06955 [Paenibacillus sp. GYB004]|uniref:hypothetical protein n=1 Tax=Paenibacillus sp. GYB004 TaxID=2994393 RepID=UPI002F9640EF
MMRKGYHYWTKTVTEDAAALHRAFQHHDNGMKEMLMVAFLGALAAILQAAGGFLPGIGLFISPLASAPIILGTVYSLRCGFLTYGVTVVVLMIIQPGELVIFPFTTGLLGIFLGFGLLRLKKRPGILVAGAAGLCAGIVLLLYVLHVPVLGPALSGSFQVRTFGILLLFCLAYSWLWVELSLAGLRKLRKILEMGVP